MRRALLIPLTPILLAGCAKESDIRVYKVPKPVPHAAPAQAHNHSEHDGHDHGPAAAEPQPASEPGQTGAKSDGMEAPASTALRWKDPAGWTREAGSGMRVASYRLPGGVEVTVISLSGTAGGDLANVNRWRGQMGQADIPSLQGAATSHKTPLGSAVVVDFEGAGPHAGKRMVAAALMDGGTSWFFKMTGPVAAVGQAKPGLLQILGSLNRA